MLLSHQCHTLSGLPHRRSGCLSQAAEKPVSPVWGSCLHLSRSSHSPSHVWCWSEGSGSVCTFEWESWESLLSLLDSTSSLEQRLRSSRTLGCGTWCRGSSMTSGVRWFYRPDSDHWFSSWSIPPSVDHWSLVSLSLDGHTQRGRDQLLLVWRWSRWEQGEADSPQWGSSAARPLTLIHLHHLTSHYSENPETDDTRPDHQRWTTRYIHHWIFPFLLFQGKRHEEDLKDWVFCPSSDWALWKEVEIWAGRPDSVSLQPSPGWTSAQRLFFQCQRLPLSAQFWWVCLVQVKL